MIAGGIFVFGLVILIHELGHFLVAKWQDVEVEAFSIGFGPSIVSIPYGETVYKICWLPLGGYVKMAGEDPAEAGDDPRSFYNKPVGQRIMILVAGGLFNLLLGFVLYVPYGMVQGITELPAQVGYVLEGRPAEGQLRVGDKILRLNGEPIDDYQTFRERSELLGDQKRVLEIVRDGERMTITLEPERIVREQFNTPSYVIGIEPMIEPEIDRVRGGSIADKAGLEPGDVIRAANGEPISSMNEFFKLVRDYTGELSLTVVRDGTEQSIKLTVPENPEETDGLGFAARIPRRYPGFVGATSWAAQRVVRDVELMYQTLKGLLGQTLEPQSLAGPLGIIDMTGEMASRGFAPLIRFTAFLSINLGVLNLLPIPILDGGHILLSIPELFTGRPLPDRVVGYVNYFGLVLLLMLFIFVTYIDLRRYETLRELIDTIPGLG